MAASVSGFVDFIATGHRAALTTACVMQLVKKPCQTRAHLQLSKSRQAAITARCCSVCQDGGSNKEGRKDTMQEETEEGRQRMKDAGC